MPPFFMPVINPPAQWSTDQALDPAADVDIYRGWASLTMMWSQNTSQKGTAGLVYVVNGGNGYVDGSYNGVAATGGHGSGCTLNITVAGNTVTLAVPATEGVNYWEGDILTVDPALIGGQGGGLQVQIIGMG